jgi:hypothetical protein
MNGNPDRHMNLPASGDESVDRRLEKLHAFLDEIVPENAEATEQDLTAIMLRAQPLRVVAGDAQAVSNRTEQQLRRAVGESRSVSNRNVQLLHYGVTDAELVRMAGAENDQVWQSEDGGRALEAVAATQVPQIGQPCYRRIFAVDIEQSTERNNSAKMSLRKAMYDLLERCMVESGITAPHRDRFVDRGDGILALIHPVDDIPKTLLLSKVVPMLDELLAGYAESHPEARLRLRAVVHAGEVHFDGHGWFGEALDVAFRLLDAPEVKKRFRASVRPLLVVVSDDIYTSVVRHGYAGIDVRAFDEVAHVKVAGQRHRGWVRTCGEQEN